MVQEKIFDHLKIRIFENRPAMAASAADAVAGKISGLLSVHKYVNIIFAAAPSQNEFLLFLSKKQCLAWNRVNAFHMDEYVGAVKDPLQLFGHFLNKKLFSQLPFGSVNYINGNASDPEAECQRYTTLLKRYPPDVCCMGIGINTHIAFNDPHEADFHDTKTVKIVSLDPVSRQQQVDDGCFGNINEVPSFALTLTIPALLGASHICCVVPGQQKALAVYKTLHAEISENHPSTILRTHPDATLFLDRDSASEILNTDSFNK